MTAFDLTSRLAVVTGARRGIGRAMARALAAAGADVIGVSASLEESGSAVEKDVLAVGRSFEAIRTDFADPEAVRALDADLAGRERPVDILINNAGTIRRAPAVEHTDADWALVLQVNLTAPFALTRAVGGSMLARGGGKVIFTASLLSFQGGITVPSYTAAKHGIAGLTKPWPPSGPRTAWTSTPSLPATSPPTTPRPSRTTRSAAAPSWTVSPPDAGATPPTGLLGDAEQAHQPERVGALGRFVDDAVLSQAAQRQCPFSKPEP
ncbi:short subunit dehydrogenase [Streptomyces sp. Ag82_O1-15]|nr:short subunit dehydrogenase [Streptomyces sp. Ag82_O1-15]